MNGKQKWLWYATGLIPAVWLGLLIAPAASGGLPEILRQFPSAMNEPFHIEWCEDSLKTVLVFIALYAMVIGVYLSTRRHYRRGEEHGSAKWGNVETVNRKYRARPPKPNKVFTQHIRMGLNGRKHKRNLNTVIIGGSGAGKTRSYAKPCLYEACLSPQGSSFVCLDPKGELLRDSGRLLEETGYEIRVLDLLHMEKSHCYNPFVYLTDDNEVQMLVTNLFKATTPKGSQTNDPFWDTTAAMLLSALVYYLYHEAPPDEQNFPMVMEMLRAGEVREEDDSYSADFFDSAWRRFRKRGAYPTAITQNVEYLLDSVQASTMLSNSEMLILLNQAPSDREKLAALLNISPEQTGYITNAPAGCGLLRYGGALVPFKNQFPKDTELYRLMTTKPDESIIVGGNTK